MFLAKERSRSLRIERLSNGENDYSVIREADQTGNNLIWDLAPRFHLRNPGKVVKRAVSELSEVKEEQARV